MLLKCATSEVIEPTSILSRKTTLQGVPNKKIIVRITPEVVKGMLAKKNMLRLPEDVQDLQRIIISDIHSSILFSVIVPTIKNKYNDSAMKIPIIIKNSSIFISTAKDFSEFRSKKLIGCNFIHEHAENIWNDNLSSIYSDPKKSFQARQTSHIQRQMQKMEENKNRTQGDEKNKLNSVIEMYKNLPSMSQRQLGLGDPKLIFNKLLGNIEHDKDATSMFTTCWVDFMDAINRAGEEIIDYRYAGRGPVKRALFKMIKTIINGGKPDALFLHGLPGNGKTFAIYSLSFFISFFEHLRYCIQRINFSDIVQMKDVLFARYKAYGNGELLPMLKKYNRLFKTSDKAITRQNFLGVFLLFIFDRIISTAREMHERLQPRLFCYVALAAVKGDNALFGEQRVFLNSGPGIIIKQMLHEPTNIYFDSLFTGVLDITAKMFNIPAMLLFWTDVVGENVSKWYRETMVVILFDEIDKFRNRHGEDSSGMLLKWIPDGGGQILVFNDFLDLGLLLDNWILMFAGNNHKNINSALASRLHHMFVASLTIDGMTEVLEKKIVFAARACGLEDVVRFDQDIPGQLATASGGKKSMRFLINGLTSAIGNLSRDPRFIEARLLRHGSSSKKKLIAVSFLDLMEHADPEFVEQLNVSQTDGQGSHVMLIPLVGGDGALESRLVCVNRGASTTQTRGPISFVGGFVQNQRERRNSQVIRDDLANAIAYLIPLSISERARFHKYLINFGNIHPDAFPDILLVSVLILIRTLLNEGQYRENIWPVAGLRPDGQLITTSYNLGETIVKFLQNNHQVDTIVIAESAKILQRTIQAEINKRFPGRKIKIVTKSTLEEFLKYAQYEV